VFFRQRAIGLVIMPRILIMRRCRVVPAHGWTFPARSCCSQDYCADRAAAVRSRCALAPWSGSSWTRAFHVAAFLWLERVVASRGGMPLIDLALLSDAVFMRGFTQSSFSFCHLCLYLVITMFMSAACIFRRCSRHGFLPLALAFCHRSRQARRAGIVARCADRGLCGADDRPRLAGTDGRVGTDAVALVLAISVTARGW